MNQSYQRHRNKWVASEVILGVAFLACGCAIYLLFRSKSLNIYQWCSAIGLSSFIDTLRSSVQSWNVSDFLKYSLPDGLYCAAYILIIDSVWHNDKGIIKNIIISLVPLVAVCNEFLQYLGLSKGTFDIYDLTCYVLPLFVYKSIQFSNNNMFNKQKKSYEKIISNN